MKRYLFILVLSLMTVISFPINNSFAATEPLSEEVFQWVQATPRSSYYFNKDAMTYEIGADGYADTNILIVPTVRLFDNMQIQDVIMKRQWRNLSTYRFDELSGVAEYLRINIKDKTVEYTDVSVQSSKIIFTLSQELDDDYMGVVFVNNITISDFIDSFYKEFTSHAHLSNSLEGIVSHSSLKDRFKNNNLIYYKDVNTVNYEHPQFLNREGYNASVPEVFKNAMLGDLVLSAKLTSVASATEYESINKDSNAIVFNNITH